MNWMIYTRFCRIRTVIKTVLAVRRNRGSQRQFGGAGDGIREFGYKWTYTEKQTDLTMRCAGECGCFFPFFAREIFRERKMPERPPIFSTKRILTRSWTSPWRFPNTNRCMNIPAVRTAEHTRLQMLRHISSYRQADFSWIWLMPILSQVSMKKFNCDVFQFKQEEISKIALGKNRTFLCFSQRKIIFGKIGW